MSANAHRPLGDWWRRSSFGLVLSAILITVVLVLLNSLAVLSYHRGVASLPLQIQVLQDEAVANPQQALQQADNRWQLLEEPERPLGYGLGALWFRLQFTPTKDYALVLDAPYLDDVQFFVLSQSGQVLQKIHTGDGQPYANRVVKTASLVLPIDPAWLGQPITVLVRSYNVGNALFPMRYVDLTQQLSLEQQRQVLHGFYLGVMIFAALLGVLLALVTQQYNLSLFSALILCIAAVQAEINGFTFQWLWPTHPQYNKLVDWCLPLAIYCCSGFIRHYFDFRRPQKSFWLFIAFEIIAVFMLLATAILQLLPNYHWQSELKQVAVYLMQLCVCCTLFISCLMIQRQPRKAALFLLPMSVLLISIVLAALRVTGVIAESALTLVALELGTTLAAILMTSSLVLNIYLEKAAITRTQQALLERNQQLSRLQQLELQRSKIAPFYGLGSRLALTELLAAQLETKHIRYRLLLVDLQNFDNIEAIVGREKTAEIVEAYLGSLLLFCTRHAPAVVSLGAERYQTVFALSQHKFALLVQESAFVNILTNLRRLLNQKFTIDGLSPDFKPRYASVSVSAELANSAEDLIAHAALALTSVQKPAGHLAYQPKLAAESRERLALLTELSAALARQQFHLLFQPVQDLNAQKVCSVEAFIRWTHPQLGAVSPAVFIPLAEEAGLICNITAWVYKEVRKIQNQLHEMGYRIPISMNLSALDLENTTLISSMLQHELKYPPAERMQFELAESAMTPDSVAALKSLELFSKAQTGLIMDDFGAGQSMLTKLGSLPIRELKMDMALLSMLGTQKENLLAGAIRLGKSMDLRVICEGVEHQRQLDFLTLHDVDAVQGYFIARPMPWPELQLWLKQELAPMAMPVATKLGA
jgi:EAL domain-containing protein (putative c-di-GMP-specific phosphodiesterase class I)/GGDEF domain-containing protein